MMWLWMWACSWLYSSHHPNNHVFLSPNHSVSSSSSCQSTLLLRLHNEFLVAKQTKNVSPLSPSPGVNLSKKHTIVLPPHKTTSAISHPKHNKRKKHIQRPSINLNTLLSLLHCYRLLLCLWPTPRWAMPFQTWLSGPRWRGTHFWWHSQRLCCRALGYEMKEGRKEMASVDGESSWGICRSPAWRGGWHGNLASGGETGEIQKFNFYEFWVN